MLTDDFKKYNLKLKVDTKLSEKVTLGVSVTPSYTETRRFDGSTHDILRQPAWLPLYLDENTIQYVNREREDGRWADAQVGDYAMQRMFDDYDLYGDGSTEVDISNTSNQNPGAKVLERERKDFKFKIFSSAYLKYDVTEDLSFKSTFSHSYNNTERSRYQGVLASRNGASATQLDISSLTSHRLVADNYFSYDKTFNDKHDLGVILGFAAEYEKATYSASQGTGYDSDNVKTLNNATTISAANNLQWEKSLASFIFRATYAYNDKYLASFSMRRDGSSIFGSEYKYGNFPAASIGWNISREDFLSDSNVISNLKLRVSYGVTGNNEVNVASYSVTDSDVLSNYYPSQALLASETYNG